MNTEMNQLASTIASDEMIQRCRKYVMNLPEVTVPRLNALLHGGPSPELWSERMNATTPEELVQEIRDNIELAGYPFDDFTIVGLDASRTVPHSGEYYIAITRQVDA